MSASDDDGHARMPSPSEEYHGPDYLHALACERIFLARQFTALGLLAASIAAVAILSTQPVAVALGLAAAYVSGSGLLRWRSTSRMHRHS